MKKYVLIMLLVLFLSVSMTVTAENLDGFTNSLETILTQTTVENQAVSASVFGGVAVLSVCLSEQIETIHFYTIINRPYTGFEVGTLTINDISELRGDYLYYADMG